jgi:outer membrane protein assembly factor BamB
MPSRRRVLVAGAALLGGCTQATSDPTATGSSPTRSDPPTDSDRPSQTPSDVTPSDDGERETVTERDPRPLSASGAWRQFGADAGHTGTSSNASFAGTGVPYWRLRRVRSGHPVVADGRLYHFALLGQDESGRQTATPTPVGTEQPLDGVPALVCRNANDGRIEWTFEFEQRRTGWAAVASGPGLVVAGFHDGVRAFDPANGQVQWHAEMDGAGSPTVAGQRVVVPVSGVVYSSGSYRRKPAVTTLDLTTGEVQWSKQPPSRAIGVAAREDAVAVVSWDWEETGSLAVRSLDDGSERWRTSFDGRSFETPTVADGVVYVNNSDGWLGTFAVADGTAGWTRSFERWSAGVAVAGDAVYAGEREQFYALNAADGSDRWAVDVGHTVRPAVAGDVVYVGQRGVEDASLFALDTTDGSKRWSHSFPFTVVEGDVMTAGLVDQPVPVEGGVYVDAIDGLYAFGPEN